MLKRDGVAMLGQLIPRHDPRPALDTCMTSFSTGTYFYVLGIWGANHGTP